VVERGDHLEVAPVGQRQHEVAGAEGRVQPAVGEPCTEARTEPLRARSEAFFTGYVGQVIEVHAAMVTDHTS